MSCPDPRFAAAGLPDSKAWGSKKSWFMGGDVRDNKIILSGSEDEAGAAAMEEKAGLEIQKGHTAFVSEEECTILSSSKVSHHQLRIIVIQIRTVCMYSVPPR